ncbi:hypothetical protein F4553_000127 [Allocatelliglobosispora scoriae]|uniref:Uncharacterized protein n=1 Tax=Allocatelliglobosispora scoriae TaxID=643052 RepID=A0A841BHF4_9ACTN|nr:hypothetical protein [Allocatelliglobosispora scoriae]MBB5866748.1 hypothetical protein [Allocatelliglobosispora scoriae]
MAEHERTEPGTAGSFGTSSVAFEVARSQTRWSSWASSALLASGLSLLVLGALDGSSALTSLGAAVSVVAAYWLAGSVRSHRDARRLERRAAARD